MQRIHRRRWRLEFKPVYSVLELARALGVSRYRLERLLRAKDVFVYRVGRTAIVPLSEIRDKLEPLWASLLETAHERHEVD